MKFKKCFFCDKIVYTPHHVTEIDGQDVLSFDMCKKCGHDYMKGAYPLGETLPSPSPPKIDLSHIKTPEELLGFLTGGAKEEKEPCKCGMTLKEFDKCGKFGCPNCYDHFPERMKQLVFPYHGAQEHVGKYPKRQMKQKWESSPEEKMKLLKLQYAKALELEEYEKAAEINKQIELLSQSPPSVFSDQ